MLYEQNKISCWSLVGRNNVSCFGTCDKRLWPFSCNTSSRPLRQLFSSLFICLVSFSILVLNIENACGKNPVQPSGSITQYSPISEEANALLLTLSSTNVSCKGSNNGSITSSVSGGSGGTVTYTLSPGSDSNITGIFTGLVVGVYTVTADDGGVLATASVSIAEPATALSLSIVSQNDVTCHGGNNGVMLLAGNNGTPGYSYSSDGGITFQPGGNFGTLSAGNYLFTVKDAAGCLINQAATIGEPATSVTLTVISQINVKCKGTSTGVVTISGSGGTAGYLFSKDGGATYQASGIFGSLSAGSYLFATKDAAGCIDSKTLVVTEPAVALSSSIPSQTNILCKGNNTGAVTIAATGGTSAYSYSIDGGISYQGSGTFSGLMAGSYTIREKDSNGCLFDQPVSITEPVAALAVLATANSPVCSNSVLTLIATGSGGTGPYSYNWTGPNAFTSTLSNPTIVCPASSATGSYVVTIKDANNCSASNAAPVTVSIAPVVTVNASISTICAGGSVTLTSSSNIPPPPSLPAPILSTANNSTGGTPANAAWTIQNDGYTTNGMTFHSNDNSSFYLSDSRSQNGAKTETILKTQAYNTVGYTSLSLGFWHYFRFNGSANESASVQVSTDGAIWTTVVSYNSTIGASNAFINESINLIAYVNKPQLFIRFYYYSDARARYWALDNISLTGTSTVGLPVISWSSNPSGFSSNLANPPAVTPGATTIYTVSYTDPATGCSKSASTTIVVNPVPVVTIQPNYCAVPGHVRLTASGGTSYTWSTGETTNPILTDIANTYGVSSTNAFGCTGSAFLPVSTELVTNGDFSSGNSGFTNAYGYTTAANGLLPEGLYAVGSDPNYFHNNFWGRDHTTNSGNFLIVNGIGSAGVVVWQETVTVLPNTEYYFSAWAISLNSVAPYANLQFNVNGSLVGTTAPLAARAANNNPPYNWQRFYGNWNSGASTSAVIQIVDLQTALGGNDFGLDDVSFGTLSPIPFSIAPIVNPNATMCSGSTMYLKANIMGGRAPITYSWSGPNGFTSALKDPVIPNVSVAYSGLYSLSVTDGYGCDPVTSTTNAIINPTPIPSISSLNGLGTVCPAFLGKYWTTPQTNVVNSWSATGGNIIGSASKDTVTIQWTSVGSGLITLTATNSVNGCDSTISKSLLIQDLVPPVLTCPATLNVPGCDETALTAPPYSATTVPLTPAQLMLAGGTVSDNCGLASLSYKDSKSGAHPVVIQRTYTATDFANNQSSCMQQINIADLIPPVLQDTPSFEFCVENLISAAIVSNLLKINPTPDYFLFKKGNTLLDLDPAGFSDNCTPSNQLILHWQINFSASTPLPSVSGIGEPSLYATDIPFPGDGLTFLDVSHTITYWLTDLSGNESIHKVATITIHPRPAVSQYTRPLIHQFDTNLKMLCLCTNTHKKTQKLNRSSKI